jgi:hypothetical protein
MDCQYFAGLALMLAGADHHGITGLDSHLE